MSHPYDEECCCVECCHVRQKPKLAKKKPASQKFHQVVEKDDGWSDWIHPKMGGYLMKCCGCGLVHELKFGVTKITKRKHGGWKEYSFVDNPNYEVAFKASRKD